MLDTGPVWGSWDCTPEGVRVASLKLDGCVVVDAPQPLAWHLPELVGRDEKPTFLGVKRSRIDRHAYLPDHVEAEVIYRYALFDLRYRVWAMAGAPGFRTQMGIRFQQKPMKQQMPSWLGGCTRERLDVGIKALSLLAAGYYNDTQHRNYDHTPILRQAETALPPGGRESIDWANLLSIRSDDVAITLVDESHRCVNQAGIDTGCFMVDAGRVSLTGMGLSDNLYLRGPSWFEFDGWRDAWACWLVLSGASTPEVRSAVKRMDRCRYPFDARRDGAMSSNTWGSGGDGEASKAAACETVVLAELASAADLGLDLVQIDSGWQCAPNDALGEKPDGVWRPHHARWPEDWNNLVRRAEELGVDVGIWFNWKAPLERMLENGRAGGFRSFKLDFLHARPRDVLEQALDKAKTLRHELGPQVIVNWDSTEVAPRMPYFLGRDFGNYYLSNRSAGKARLSHIDYKPHLQLRDAWHLSNYLNLNQFQLTVQDIDRVNANTQVPRPYSHAYCFGAAMAGLPIFFQLTQQLSRAARDELRPLIALYRKHRHEILNGFVEPIGDEPDDRSLTGFRVDDPVQTHIHLLVFREANCRESHFHVDLGLAAQNDARAATLYSTSRVQFVAVDGGLNIEMSTPATFAWVRIG